MFVRFAQTAARLQCALVETRRTDGKVRQEHIAQLGTVALPLSVAGRLAFWAKLHDRLGRLSNRVGKDQGKILEAIHARIPMVMIAEQQAFQSENIAADKRLWDGLAEGWQEEAEGKQALVVKLQADIAAAEERANLAKEAAADSQARLDRLHRGESVDGGLRRLTGEDMEAILAAAGWTKGDMRHVRRVHQLTEAEFAEYLKYDDGWQRRLEKAAVRALLRRRR